ncbi:MAG: 5-(carboxyamino)imidazole ribonucleotide synthase [Anaerolineales bacterium]
MTTIGILGAGQLGRMLALAGYPLGMRFRFIDPASDSPAGRLAEHLAFDYSDRSALEQFASGLDVITYEFENVPVESAGYLQQFVSVYPTPIALETARDRFVEKTFFCKLGIPTPKFTPDLKNERINEIGYPAVLKTRRMGYDGKGQVIIHSQLELNREIDGKNTAGFILEEFISFDRELSIIGVRNKTGDMKFYPLVENHHRDGILRLSLMAGNVSPELQQQAEQYARKAMATLDYVGVLTIEFFEKDGRLLANEMAPRVHNSGHWTIEGSVTSQFENHLRAVSGSPLGSTDPLGVCAMVNVVGDLPDVTSILKIEGAHLHLYDKVPRPKRKIGHVTFVENKLEVLQRKLDLLKEIVHV